MPIVRLSRLCPAASLFAHWVIWFRTSETRPRFFASAKTVQAWSHYWEGDRGANTLALTIAHGLETRAAITTAGESRFGIALDNPPAGWRCSNPAAAKPVMAAFLAGDPVHIKNNLKTEVDLEWLPLGEIGAPGPDSNPILNSASSLVLALSEAPAAEDCFTLHPATHVIGIDERGVSIDDVRSL